MSRNVALSLTFLMIIGGVGFALPERGDTSNFHGAPSTPSSGSLGPAADTDIRNASPMFSAMPKGGFGPPTASFQIQNRHLSVVQPHRALQFKERWLFDYASDPHRPHHQQHRRRRSVLWSFLGTRSCYRCPAHVRPEA